MSDSVGSTSWPNRNRAHFERLEQLLREREPAPPPTVLLAGPGAVTRLCRPLLRDESRPASVARRAVGDLGRHLDQFVRRIPWMPLESLEACELEQSLRIPHRLMVIDVSQRVLDAVARDVAAAECRRVDLSREGPPWRCDVIVAFNVVSRLADGQTGTARLIGALEPGGLLLMDDRSARQFLPAGRFEAVAPKIHRMVLRG